MKYYIHLIIFIILSITQIKAQNPWMIDAKSIDKSNYYGITLANGVMGIVSSPQPLKLKEVVLAGLYDMYRRGWVSNFLPSFNMLNHEISIDGVGISKYNISVYSGRNRTTISELTDAIC